MASYKLACLGSDCGGSVGGETLHFCHMSK